MKNPYKILIFFILFVSLMLPGDLQRVAAMSTMERPPVAGAQDEPSSSGVIAITAGWGHTCALTADGEVKCWGYNAYGQLGDGTNSDNNDPQSVTGLSNGVVAISAGAYHTCALTDGGAVKCWGRNWYGLLGDGTEANSNIPVDVPGLSSGVVAIAAGMYHTCALTDAGGVMCWGDNEYGELGNDEIGINTHTPVPVKDLSSGVAAIASGWIHTCAVINDGTVKCWGQNQYGELGDGTTINGYVPVPVSGLSGSVAAVATGSYYTCALTTVGEVQCWGMNESGQLGDDTYMSNSIPVGVIGFPVGVTSIAAGGYHTCVLTSGGTAMCWGDNTDGQLGDGTYAIRGAPVSVTGLSSGTTSIVAGWGHTCALSNGSVMCWGRNWYGQLGCEIGADSNIPVVVSDLEAVQPVPVITTFSPTSGGEDTIVTITGNNLTGATEVAFNGVSASFVVNSATQITVTVPSDATTGTISVTTPGGTAFSSTAYTVNTAPIAVDDSYVFHVDIMLGVPTLGVLSNDTDEDENILTAVKVSDPAHGALDLNTDGSFTYTPVIGYNGTDTFTYKANDGFADSNIATVLLIPDDTPIIPVPVITTFSPTSGWEYTSVTISGSEFNDATEVTFNGVNASFVVNSPIQIVAEVPEGATTGVISVTTPGGTAFSSTVFTMNRAPVAVDDSYIFRSGVVKNISAPGVLSNDTDEDGNPLTAIKVNNPAHGTLTLNADGSFIYTPVSGYNSTDTFTYKANDGFADSNTATVLLIPDNWPTNLAPADGTVVGVGISSLNLSWELPAGKTSTDVRRYQLQVSYTPDFSGTLFLDTTTRYLYYTLTNLTPNTTYYWRVRAMFRTGTPTEGTWSSVNQVMSFSTQKTAPPTLTSPANGARITYDPVRLRWSRPSGCPTSAAFLVQYSRDSNFATGTTEIKTTATSYSLYGLSGTYYWRVKAISDTSASSVDYSDFSTARSFRR